MRYQLAIGNASAALSTSGSRQCWNRLAKGRGSVEQYAVGKVSRQCLKQLAKGKEMQAMSKVELNNSFKSLTVYKKAFELAMMIFELSKSFPKEERYSLTDQIRRSSRSVCSSVAESYRKRLYKAHFVSKVSDADMENSETQVWLEFASACGYLSKEKFEELVELSLEIGKLLNHMITHPELYQRKNEKI